MACNDLGQVNKSPVQPFFYKIKRQDSPKTSGYILGTIHWTDKGLTALNSKIIKSLAKSHLLGFEYIQEFHESEIQEFYKRASPKVKQGIAALHFLMLQFQLGPGIENLLIKIAKQNNIKLVDLDMMELQLKSLTTMAELIHSEKIFKGDSEEISQQKHLFSKIMNAWKAGNEEDFINCFTSLEESNDALFVERNERMANKIHELLINADDRIFIAVGTIHLLLNQNILELLKAKGWSIKRVWA